MNISAASLTDYQIIEWFTSNVVYGNQTIYNAMRSSAIQNCRYQVCAALEWEGIADLAGVGMVITYFLYAVITTFLFCVMMLDHFYFTGQPHYRSNFLSPYLGLLPKFKPRIYYRLFTATYLCIDAFLATSTVFALSLLAASIFQNAYNILTAGVYATVYATLLSVLLPIFSIFPIAIIQVTSSFTSGFTSLSRNRKMRTESSGRGGTERGRKRETLRRPKLRKAIWILLGLLVTVVVILSFINLDLLNRSRSRTRTLSSTSPAAASATGEGREEKGEGEFYTWLSPQQEFEQWCAPREKESSIRFAILLSILIFAMGVIVWFILIFLRDFPILGIGIGITPLFSPASAPGRFFHFLKVVKRYWWSIVALVNMAGMWVFLTLFTQYRRLIVERAGTSQQDSRWSIGQVLALATWAPWVVDFLYLLVCECCSPIYPRVCAN